MKTPHQSGPENGNPAIDKMAMILLALERAPDGLDLRSLANTTGIARSTTYRILNSLEFHGYVRQISRNRFILGHRLFALGEGVGNTMFWRDLPHLLGDWMKGLAIEVGETVRLSVNDRGTIIAVAGASPPVSHALTYVVGDQSPIHAGGASKVLLASLPEVDLKKILAKPLQRFTENTLTDPVLLQRELEEIRRRGWGADRAEFSARVQSYAIPLTNRKGKVVAAASVAFSTTDQTEFHHRILNALLAARSEGERLVADVLA